MISSSHIRVLSLLIIFTLGCETGPQKPENLIEEDVYIDMVVELQLLKSLKVIQTDINSDSLEQVIYSKYSITEERFLESHYYYQKDLAEQSRRIETAMERVKEEQGKGLNTTSDS